MFDLACHSRLFGEVFFNCTEIQRRIHHNIAKHISSAAELRTVSGSGKHSAHRCGFRRFKIAVTKAFLGHKSLGTGLRHILIQGIASIRIQLAADHRRFIIHMDDLGVDLPVGSVEPEPKEPVLDIQIKTHSAILIGQLPCKVRRVEVVYRIDRRDDSRIVFRHLYETSNHSRRKEAERLLDAAF